MNFSVFLPVYQINFEELIPTRVFLNNEQIEVIICCPATDSLRLNEHEQ